MLIVNVYLAELIKYLINYNHIMIFSIRPIRQD